MIESGEAGMPETHHLVCGCGFDPWKALQSENSGPDEDSARIALKRHLRENNPMWAGGRSGYFRKVQISEIRREQGSQALNAWVGS